MRQRFARRHQIVELQTDADLPRLASRAAIQRNEELERLDEMRAQRQQPLALAQRLMHEIELEMLEISQPAVDEPRRRAARPAADVAAIEEQRLQAAQRRLARNRGAVDPGADHDQVESDGVPPAWCGGA